MKGKKAKFNFTYFLAAFFAISLLQQYLASNSAQVVPYSQFSAALNSGELKEVVVSGEKVRATLKNPQNGKNVLVANKVDPDLFQILKDKNVEYRQEIQSTFLRDLLSWIVPMAFFIFVWIFISRKMMPQSGSFMSVGKSKAKIYVEKSIKIGFKDVAGVDEAKAELEEVIQFLKDPKKSGRLGAVLPKGILLVGPPGTGKTLLAKAVAGEAQVPFFSISGSEFVEMFVGVGAARVRDLFEQARNQAPCIIFIDELDALGKARSAGHAGGGHDEKEQTLNQLLVELDGFDTTQGVVLLAATNRPEILDPALLRAGRFDRQVLVDRPDKSGRIQILKVHAKKIKIDPELNMQEVAALTPGFTGADLANLVNEAALSATRAGREKVTLTDFNDAIERILAGLEKRSRVLNEKERSIVAYHEMGHAFVAAALPGTDVVHKVSIIPRGIGALGYTIQRPTEDRYLMSAQELEDKMAVLLGGRASEKLFFNSISTGSSDDVARATDIAKSMVARYAMIEELGHVAYEERSQAFLESGFAARQFSEKTQEAMDRKIKELMDTAFNRAYLILELNRDLVEGAARELLAKETLVGPELTERFTKIQRTREEA